MDTSVGKTPASDPVDLLWTGGWDSTFRLLYLLYETEAVVQPWYGIDEERGSVGTEVRAMASIRRAVNEHLPQSNDRLLPTRYRSVGEIQPNPEITQWHQGLRKQARFGIQYEWLSRLAHEMKLSRLELCVSGTAPWSKLFLWPYVQEVQEPYGMSYRLKDHIDKIEVEILRPFRFPLLGRTKQQIATQAEAAGFHELLEMTWFCHRPILGKPCGRCMPCIQAKERGMGSRIPWTRRILNGQLIYGARKINAKVKWA